MTLRSVRATAIVVAALALSACVPVPPGPTAPAPGTSSPPPPVVATVEFFFVVNQPTRLNLIGEPQEVEYRGDLLDAALGALIDGSVQPRDPDYVNLWGDGTGLNEAVVDDGTLRLDLSMGVLNVGSEGEARAIEQLVWTATGIDPTIQDVAFTVDGAVVDSLAGAVDARGTFSRGAPENVLNPVAITFPAEGAEVSGPLTVSGTACVFEANVSWRLASEGAIVAEGFTMADGGCPTRGAWRVDLGALAPGSYTFSAIEYSMKDGSVASMDDKRFTVTAG